jgi:hypothetical protein
MARGSEHGSGVIEVVVVVVDGNEKEWSFLYRRCSRMAALVQVNREEAAQPPQREMEVKMKV